MKRVEYTVVWPARSEAQERSRAYAIARVDGHDGLRVAQGPGEDGNGRPHRHEGRRVFGAGLVGKSSGDRQEPATQGPHTPNERAAPLGHRARNEGLGPPYGLVAIALVDLEEHVDELELLTGWP